MLAQETLTLSMPLTSQERSDLTEMKKRESSMLTGETTNHDSLGTDAYEI